MFLCLASLTKIFHGAQGTNCRVEEGQEIGDEYVIEEKLTVSVFIGSTQFFDMLFEFLDERVALNRFRPIRQIGLRRSGLAIAS